MNQNGPGELLEYDEIVSWVLAHREVLSAGLSTIVTYPISFRKVIVDMMSPAQRLTVWRQHLAAAAAAPELSEAQRVVVLETAAELAKIFSSPIAMRDWQQRANRLFTASERHAIFGTLGPLEPPGGLPLPQDAMMNHVPKP